MMMQVFCTKEKILPRIVISSFFSFLLLDFPCIGMWLGSVCLDVCFVITKWGRPFLSEKKTIRPRCVSSWPAADTLIHSHTWDRSDMMETDQQF
jgi:hypothetical protein